MPSPIPLHCRLTYEDIATAGTGFVVHRGTEKWLVTCVHNVTGMRITPGNNNSHFFNTEFIVVGTNLKIPLVADGVQRFKVIRNTADNTLLDVLTVPLTETEKEALAAFGSYDLSELAVVSEGDEIAVEGFAGLGYEWIPPTTSIANVSRIFGVSVALDKPTQIGLSGSAATHNGKLVGVVHADEGEKSDMKSALVITLTGLEPGLFP